MLISDRNTSGDLFDSISHRDARSSILTTPSPPQVHSLLPATVRGQEGNHYSIPLCQMGNLHFYYLHTRLFTHVHPSYTSLSSVIGPIVDWLHSCRWHSNLTGYWGHSQGYPAWRGQSATRGVGEPGQLATRGVVGH